MLPCFFLLLAAAAPPEVALQLSASGGYTLSVDGAPWLVGAPTVVNSGGKRHSTADGTLIGTTTHSHTGCDTIGDFKATIQGWAAGGTPFETEFRVYAAVGAVIFEQRFPNGAEGTASPAVHPQTDVISSFPAFELSAAAQQGSTGPAGYVQFAGLGVPTSHGCQMGPWPPTGERSAHSCQLLSPLAVR